MPRVLAAAVVMLTLAGATSAASAAQPVVQPPVDQPDAASLDLFVRGLESILQHGDTNAFLALLGSSANRPRAIGFASTELLPGASHAVVQERDRQKLP